MPGHPRPHRRALHAWLQPGRLQPRSGRRLEPLASLSLLLSVWCLLQPGPTVAGPAQATSAQPPRQPRVHVVRPTENLSKIAKRYGVSVGQLRRWNGIRGDRILAGQRLSLGLDRATTYTTRRGDTLSGIAQRFGVSANSVKRLSGLKDDRIHVGQKLVLRNQPPPRPSKARRSAASPDRNRDIHVVKRGDTLSEIALAHKVSLSRLKKLNTLSTNRITVGQRLRLRPARATSEGVVAPPSTSEEEVAEYVVRKGDTLSEIALRFDVGLGLLRQLNKLPDDHIRSGQKLKLRPSRKDEGVHVVLAGETLSAIAVAYSIELRELRRLNGIDSDRILVGQKLRLKTTPSATHIVERGDALWEIARAYSMTVSEVKEINGLRGDVIYPGQELRLNPKKARRLELYTVLRGDNLSEIARLHQMSVAELKRVNTLDGSVIHPGRQLKVRPLLGRPTKWLEVSEIRWADLRVSPSGVEEVSLGNGPYYKRRPRADQQKSDTYFEGHPASPLKTYRQARTLWTGFERAVAGMGRLSDELKGWHIVLDPGHGGLDPGAVVPSLDGSGKELYVVEDEYVYDIALRTYVLFRLHGAHVEMTLLSPNHLIRQSAPPALTFVHEKNEVYNSYQLNKSNRRSQWPSGSRRGLDARVKIAREAFAGSPKGRRIFLSFHADIDRHSPEAPLVLYYESRNGRKRDLRSREFARALVPALGAGTRTRGQGLAVLRDNPAYVKVLVELRNLAYVDHAWALRYEQLRHRDAEKVVKGVLDYVRRRRMSAGR